MIHYLILAISAQAFLLDGRSLVSGEMNYISCRNQ